LGCRKVAFVFCRGDGARDLGTRTTHWGLCLSIPLPGHPLRHSDCFPTPQRCSPSFPQVCKDSVVLFSLEIIKTGWGFVAPSRARSTKRAKHTFLLFPDTSVNQNEKQKREKGSRLALWGHILTHFTCEAVGLSSSLWTFQSRFMPAHAHHLIQGRNHKST